MGKLIATGVNKVKNHTMDIEYSGEGESRVCTLKCACGWTTLIHTFRNAGSIIEVRVKANDHFESVGLAKAAKS